MSINFHVLFPLSHFNIPSKLLCFYSFQTSFLFLLSLSPLFLSLCTFFFNFKYLKNYPPVSLFINLCFSPPNLPEL